MLICSIRLVILKVCWSTMNNKSQIQVLKKSSTKVLTRKLMFQIQLNDQKVCDILVYWIFNCLSVKSNLIFLYPTASRLTIYLNRWLRRKWHFMEFQVYLCSARNVHSSLLSGFSLLFNAGIPVEFISKRGKPSD